MSPPPARRTLIRAFFGACGLAALPAGAQVSAPGQDPLPVVILHAAGTPIRAEFARTERQRETGLMGRTRLAPNSGMLFGFKTPRLVCMWMRDTPLPLSVAFIDQRGRIVNLADMQPLTLDPHCSMRPVSFALEMPRGWFAAHGLGPGGAISGGPFASGAD